MNQPKKQVIALVDDDADDRDVFTEVFTMIDSHLNLLVFENGEQFLEYLNTPGNKYPEILFLDINMPVKNGFDYLQEIKGNTQFVKICIIMYSTSSSKADVQKSKDLGADGFLQKPSSIHKLNAALREILDTDWNDPCREIKNEDFLITA